MKWLDALPFAAMAGAAAVIILVIHFWGPFGFTSSVEPTWTDTPQHTTNNNEGGAAGDLRLSDDDRKMVELGNQRNTPVCQRMCIGASAVFIEYDHSNPNAEHRCVCAVDGHFLYVYGAGDMGEGTRYQWEPVAGQ